MEPEIAYLAALVYKDHIERRESSQHPAPAIIDNHVVERVDEIRFRTGSSCSYISPCTNLHEYIGRSGRIACTYIAAIYDAFSCQGSYKSIELRQIFAGCIGIAQER